MVLTGQRCSAVCRFQTTFLLFSGGYTGAWVEGILQAQRMTKLLPRDTLEVGQEKCTWGVGQVPVCFTGWGSQSWPEMWGLNWFWQEDCAMAVATECGGGTWEALKEPSKKRADTQVIYYHHLLTWIWSYWPFFLWSKGEKRIEMTQKKGRRKTILVESVNCWGLEKVIKKGHWTCKLNNQQCLELELYLLQEKLNQQ